jgi:hypothetical protein
MTMTKKVLLGVGGLFAFFYLVGSFAPPTPVMTAQQSAAAILPAKAFKYFQNCAEGPAAFDADFCFRQFFDASCADAANGKLPDASPALLAACKQNRSPK